MNLKEKYKIATSQWFDTTECEKIANDYTLEVMEWYRKKCIMSNFDMYMTVEKALEMYKQEHNL